MFSWLMISLSCFYLFDPFTNPLPLHFQQQHLKNQSSPPIFTKKKNTMSSLSSSSSTSSFIINLPWKKILIGGGIAIGTVATLGAIIYNSKQRILDTVAPIQQETSQIKQILKEYKQKRPELFQLRENDDTVEKIINFERDPLTLKWKLNVRIHH